MIKNKTFACFARAIFIFEEQQGESLMTARTTTFNPFWCVSTPKRYAHFYNVKIRGWKSRKILQYYANNTFADREFSGWKFSYLRTFFPIVYWDKNENEFCDKTIQQLFLEPEWAISQ